MSVIVEDIPLPKIREDLQLIEASSAYDGSPTWNIFDPIRNRYYKIGWSAFQIISRWSVGTINTLIEKVNAETVCRVTEDDIKQFVTFLQGNGLTVLSPHGTIDDYIEQYEQSKKSWASQIVHNYLYFRIPLVKPDKFLKNTLSIVEPLYSKTFFYFIFLIGILGFYLVARQWDVFVNSFLYFFNLNGLVLYLISICFLKIFHELGHAYTATRYGTKVSTIGVAFLIMFPVLYTDVSDSWKIKSRKQRLHIGAAGMQIEIYIACIATLVWSFLDDGVFRSIVFLLATSSWLMSVAINLNPFMRFDGYYLLSDYWSVENLQGRAFKLGQWKLREILFGLGLPKPENLPKSTMNKMVFYAWFTWVYRFFLFLGIALLVYHFFIKLLGIVLFLIEIVWFILLPVYREISQWWGMKTNILKSRRFYIALALFINFLYVLFLPWSSTIRLPAIIESTENITIFSPVESQIVELAVSEGELIEKDQLLLKLDSPVLTEELAKTQKQIEALELKIKRLSSSKEGLKDIHVMLSSLDELNSKKIGLENEAELLNIYSPIKGKVIDVYDNLHTERWINQEIPLMNIIDEHDNQVVAFVSEKEISRIAIEQYGHFYPENIELSKFEVKINEIQTSNVKNLETDYVNHEFGGEIVTRNNSDKEKIPESATYKVVLEPTQPNLDFMHVLRGTVHVETKPISIYNRVKQQIFAVFIRETGF